MGGGRLRYEELSPSLKARVDTSMGRAVKETPRRRSRRGPNRTEEAYRVEILAARRDVRVVRYEALTFRMENGHRYTPDWLVVTAGGQIECHEVKGGYALHSQQRARLAFDQVRVEFPWVRWVWAVRTKGGWEIAKGDGEL